MSSKDTVHRLIDELPPRELEAVRRFAEYLRLRSEYPAIGAAMAAPLDDEPETAEEAEAVREALDDLEHGRIINDDKLIV